MKTPARALLALAILASGRSAAASPVPSMAYQRCWIDYWDTGSLWCDLYASGLNGGGLLETNAIHPVWSPDGSKIAFRRFVGGSLGGMEVLDVVTGTMTSINGGVALAWSPDGSKIVSLDGEPLGNLVVANVDGSGAVQITTSGDIQGRPAWSPDGARIAYGCLGASGFRDICTMNPDGTDVVQLTDDPGEDADPAYSPDGTRIAFTTGPVPYGGTSVMTSTGTDRHGTQGGYWPAWSPDGTRIATGNPYSGACQADGFLCYDELSVIDPDGTAAPQWLGTGSFPSWTASAQLTRPIARFSSYCEGAGNCSFYGDSWDMDGTIVAETWDFGDGTTASGHAFPTYHTYATYGAYSVTYTVTDNDGNTVTASGIARHWAQPVPVITHTCALLQCTFDGTASHDADGTIVAYEWFFLDGGMNSGPITNHTFAGPGNYWVYLYVTDNDGQRVGTDHMVTVTASTPPVAAFTSSCTQNQCAFNGLGSFDPDGTITGYAWTFDDGSTGAGATTSHTFAAVRTFLVGLTVTDNSGLQSTVWHAVTVTLLPVADFSFNCTHNQCAFNGSTSFDPQGGTITGYAWAFGDGSTGTGSVQAHAYAVAGTFTATLTVTNSAGLQGAVSHSLTVTMPPLRPVAAFMSSCTQNQCAFNGAGSSDPDGTIAAHAWTFGDGTTGAGATPAHTYAAAGTFNVVLTVTDNSGLQGSVSHAVTVTMPPVPPVAVFTVSCTDAVCAFNGSGSYDPDGTIATYAWTFGDGVTGTGATASHTYAAAGTYTASLRVTDNQGLQGTVSHPVTVTAPRSHVGDLDGATTGSGGSWTATVTVVIHGSGEAVLANATVTGAWSIGGSSSCTTNAAGQCAVSKASIPNKTHTATFTVTGVTHATRPYDAAANHDPDGDSTGTAITLSR
jgi:PKD repeat protein